MASKNPDTFMTWSVYFDSNFSDSQTNWADIFQLHPINNNYAPPNWSVADVKWPAVQINGTRIGFGVGGDLNTEPCCWHHMSDNVAGPWRSTVSAMKTAGWTDFAMIAHWSSGSDGFIRFYVNGDGYEYDGPTMGYVLLKPTERAYYVKQGYYRDACI